MVLLCCPSIFCFFTSSWTEKPDTNESEREGQVEVKANVQISGAADDQQVQGVTVERSDPKNLLVKRKH